MRDTFLGETPHEQGPQPSPLVQPPESTSRRSALPVRHLKAANGEIIASSEGYTTKASAHNGIESVQKNAPGAAVVDLTE